MPDDHADRYLPEILARFSPSKPRVEATVIREPTPILVERIDTADLGLVIMTHVESRGRPGWSGGNGCLGDLEPRRRP